MAADPQFLKAAYNTLYYTLLAVPIGAVVAMGLALSMNQRLREVSVYRAIYYLPSISRVRHLVHLRGAAQPRVRAPELGAVTARSPVAQLAGTPPTPSSSWCDRPARRRPVRVGLPGRLHGVPVDLYESADIDGAGGFQKFLNITLPMMTPMILYDLIIGLSSDSRSSHSAFILTGGGTTAEGADNSLLTYVFYLYRQAFQFGQMGYAAAAVGGAVHRQPPPRGRRLPLGPQLGLLRR